VKYLNIDSLEGDLSQAAQDPRTATAMLTAQLGNLEDQLATLPEEADPVQRNTLIIQSGYTLLELERGEEAWARARPLLIPTVEAENWLQAVELCDVLYQAEQEESLRALAHGVWLGVTYPIDPELSVSMLQHIVDETPDNSDGGAVAAAVASYLVDMRAEGEQHEQLHFFTTQMLGKVAFRHSKVEEEDIFKFWVERLELDDTEKLFPRLAKILDIMTDGQWWFDRDALRARIPS
jgi:hypothetical protein